jgi:pyridoxal phosphate enzyme (YggS family)
MERIGAAARRSGRHPEAIRLMAVTKTVEEERILEAVAAGVQIFGENYVQEARRKIEALGPIGQWHLIGNLQTNKARYAARLFHSVDTIDRIEAAEALNQRCSLERRTMPVLIEVNTSGEATNRGVAPQDALELIRRIAPLEHLAVQGLMPMAPWFDAPPQARPGFTALRRLRDRLVQASIPRIDLRELSMGMSDDYEIASRKGPPWSGWAAFCSESVRRTGRGPSYRRYRLLPHKRFSLIS